MTLKERAEKVAELVAGGFCTRYPGYVCGKGFPAACPACVTSWIIRNGIKERDDTRINIQPIKSRPTAAEGVKI
jgi:hypothetical protein